MNHSTEYADYDDLLQMSRENERHIEMQLIQAQGRYAESFNLYEEGDLELKREVRNYRDVHRERMALTRQLEATINQLRSQGYRTYHVGEDVLR